MRGFVLLALVAVAASAQTTALRSLGGTVTDPSGGTLPGARVSVTERAGLLRRSTTADASGHYRFSTLPEGEYLVEANAEGFGVSAPQTARVIGADTTLDLRLDLPRVSTQVQVTAAGTAQTVDEQSKAMDIIDSTQLERRAEFALSEAVQQAAGIRVQQLGGPGSFVRILLRGLRASDTSVLVDGFRLRDAAAPQGDDTGFLSDLLLVDTDRIEILRGSGSSLYGTHASGGVVNIVTDQGGGPFHGNVGAEGGGLGLFRGFAKVSGGEWQDRLRYTGGATHLNISRGVDGNDRARNWLGHGFVQYQIGPATTISGRVLESTVFAQLNDEPFPSTVLPSGTYVPAVPGVTFTPSSEDPDRTRTAQQFSGLVALNHSFHPRSSVRVSYGAVTTHRDNNDGPGGHQFEPSFPVRDRFDGRIDTLQGRTDLNIGRFNALTAGYEFERESFGNWSRDFNPNLAERVSARLNIAQRSHAVFAQDQIQLFNRRLQVSLSGRLQAFQLERPTFAGGQPLYGNARLDAPPRAQTGDVSVAYLLSSSGSKLRAHVGNGYRAPALYERFGSSYYFGSFSAYGDPNLRPDRLLAIDGGFDQYFASSKLRVSGTYFYTRIQEAIFFDFSGNINPTTDPYGRFGGYANTGGGLARGVELSVEAAPYRTLTLRSSYTFTKAAERRSALLGGSLRSYRIPDHMFTITASQRLGKNFDVTLDLFASSNYIYPFSGRAFVFAGPRKADLAANYTIALSDRHQLRFFTRVENFLNRTYYEEGFPTPKAWATGGMKFLF